MDRPYLLTIPGLSEAVKAAPVETAHKSLLRSLSRFEQLRDIRYATCRGGDGGTYLVRCKVLDKDGNLISDDRDKWLEEQMHLHGGRARSVYEALKDSGYLVSKCEIESVYLTVDRGGSQANFLQVEIDVQTEYVDRPLFDWYTHNAPRDLRDLQRDASSLPNRKLLAAPIYELKLIADMQSYIDLARAVHETRRQEAREKQVTVTELALDGSPGQTVVTSLASLDPTFERFPWWRGERLFHDWTLSSAGRSGARLCEHWVMDLQDYQHPATDSSPLAGQRFVEVVPLWTHTRKMAKIQRAPSIHALYDKLSSLDRRTGVPFAWFFYMVHGNLVEPSAGKAVLEGAETGVIVLQEHDYQVLRRWGERSYGF